MEGVRGRGCGRGGTGRGEVGKGEEPEKRKGIEGAKGQRRGEGADGRAWKG